MIFSANGVALASFSQAVRTAFNPTSDYFLWIWGAMTAVLLAFVIACLYRLIVGLPIRRLLAKQASDEGTACTLADLGCDHAFYRFCLRPQSLLRKMVLAIREAKAVQNCENDTPKAQNSTNSEASAPSADAESTAYYIPAEQSYRAERTFSFSAKTFLALPVVAAALFLLGLVLFWVIPAAF